MTFRIEKKIQWLRGLQVTLLVMRAGIRDRNRRVFDGLKGPPRGGLFACHSTKAALRISRVDRTHLDPLTQVSDLERFKFRGMLRRRHRAYPRSMFNS